MSRIREEKKPYWTYVSFRLPSQGDIARLSHFNGKSFKKG
nr:MAG TPA: hypothetical protein [Bacteriophage sp.]